MRSFENTAGVNRLGVLHMDHDVSKTHEFASKNEELCIKIEEFCIINDGFVSQMMNFAGRR